MIKTNRKIFISSIALMFTLVTSLGLAADEANPLFENLVPVSESEVAVAYIDPNADFSIFKRAMVLDTFVAFRSGWERDQRRGTRGTRISSSDMDRTKEARAPPGSPALTTKYRSPASSNSRTPSAGRCSASRPKRPIAGSARPV